MRDDESRQAYDGAKAMIRDIEGVLRLDVIDVQMDRWIEGGMDGQVDKRQLDIQDRFVDGQMDNLGGQMDEFELNIQIDGQIDNLIFI